MQETESSDKNNIDSMAAKTIKTMISKKLLNQAKQQAKTLREHHPTFNMTYKTAATTVSGVVG